jgi:non-ribosomal peptide synthetase component E (peptide arylation enzyme)
MPNIHLVLVMLTLAWYTPSASALQDSDGSVIDFFIARQARRERGEEYREARKVMVGELTGDGVPETVVLYTLESQGGTNNYVQYVAVFARGNRGLIPVTHTEVGGKMRRSVELSSVDNNAIQLATLSYGPKDPSCCPSVKGTTCYALVGRALREQKRGKGRGGHD